MVPPKLKIVELKARDWLGTVEWFLRHFGLTMLLMDQNKQYALLGDDYGTDANLSIKGTAEVVAGNQLLLQWEVNHLPGFVAKLEQQGVRILKPVQEASDEWYQRAVIEGPEGLVMLLFEFTQASRTPTQS